MKLLFDARYIRTDFHDGISRYSTELGRALATLTEVIFLIHDDAQKQFLPKNAQTITIHAPTSVKEPFTARILNKFKPDVVYSPMQTMGSAGRNYKLILTSHDMIYFRHKTPPKNLHSLIRTGWYLYHTTYIPERLALNGADIVATVSSTVQREFEQAKLTKRPVIVVPNAPQQFEAATVAQSNPRNLIYMGSFMPYKNVELLVRGMKHLPEYTLHLLSKISATRRQELEALAPRGANIIFHGGVSDEAYARLLADNAILVSASLDEGYGLPVAEALAMGVPAVISNIPIFHEVAAGGALYFDPAKPKAFADQIRSLEKKATRNEIVASGKAHIQTFDWNSSARTLLNAIHSLL